MRNNNWYPHIDTGALNALRDECNKLRQAHPHSALIRRYFDDFRSSYIYNTNAIEGNTISHNDTYFIIHSGTFLENYTATESMEVIGSNDAWNYCLTMPELTVETILGIHRRVLFFNVEHAGVFRNQPVFVGGKQMPDAEHVGERVARLFEIDEADVFRRIALFHLSFENTHPFIDGNGRTGRMLINLQLMAAGFLPINIKFNAVGRYYRCFRQYDVAPKKGIQEMYNLITKYEHEELINLIEALNDTIPNASLHNRQ